MKLSTTQILEQLNAVNAKILAIGPVLIGTLKKNKCRKTRADGSRYVSENDYHTFVYRDHQGKEAWKRFNAKHLPEIQRLKKKGDEYKKLARLHMRLTIMLAVAGVGKKKRPLPQPRFLNIHAVLAELADAPRDANGFPKDLASLERRIHNALRADIAAWLPRLLECLAKRAWPKARGNAPHSRRSTLILTLFGWLRVAEPYRPNTPCRNCNE